MTHGKQAELFLDLLRIRLGSTSESLKAMLHGLSLSSLAEELLGKPLNKDGTGRVAFFIGWDVIGLGTP